MNLTAEFFGYVLVSGLALLVDALLLWGLVSCGVQYLFASSISFTVGGFVAWWLSTRYVFHTHRVHNRRVELLLFLALGLAGLGINALVIFFVVQWVHGSLPLAKASATGFTFMSNYLLRRFALFASMGGVST